MKPYITIVALSLFCGLGYSQEEEKVPSQVISKSVLIYTNFQYDPVEYKIPLESNRTLTMSRSTNLVQPSFALRTTRSNGWSRELEFNNLTLLRVENLDEVTRIDTLNQIQLQFTDGHRRTTSSIGARFEWMKICHSSRSEKLKLYLGVGVNAGLYYMILDPLISTEFRHSIMDFSLNSQVIPRMTYDFSNRVRLDINILANWITNNLYVVGLDNPRIPEGERTASNYDLTLLSPQVHVRVGLAFDIWEVN